MNDEQTQTKTYPQIARRVVLVAEDDTDMRNLLSQALRQKGYSVTECSDGVQLMNHLRPMLESSGDVDYDLIITDVRMPGALGTEVIEGLNECGNRPPVILITAFGDQALHDRAGELGVAGVFDKPFDLQNLIAQADDAINQAGSTDTNNHPHDQGDAP